MIRTVARQAIVDAYLALAANLRRPRLVNGAVVWSRGEIKGRGILRAPSHRPLVGDPPPFVATRNNDIGKLVVLMITAFIDMVGTLMIIPLLPFYAKNFGANGLMVGLLVSSFAIAQLVSAPMWGRFSDRYGRRPALIVGMSASAIAYVVFAYSNTLWLLFLSRLIQGSGGGTVSVIQAYVADAVEPDQRAKALGLVVGGDERGRRPRTGHRVALRRVSARTRRGSRRRRYAFSTVFSHCATWSSRATWWKPARVSISVEDRGTRCGE